MEFKDSNKELPEIDSIIKAEIAETKTCPECNSTKLMLDIEHAEVVCMECGFVIQQKIADEKPEWRVFDEEQKSKRARVGAPLTYTIHDKGLTTVIDWHNRDVYGKNLSGSQKAQVYRLRKWQRRIRTTNSTERNLIVALSEIAKTSSNLNLPKNVLETAAIIYRKAVKEHLTSGRSIKGIAAAALYLSCRQCELPKTLDEVAQASSINKKEIGKNYRCLIKNLEYTTPPLRPNQYITKFFNQLSTQGKNEEIAYKILTTAKNIKLTSGRGPTGIAAAASYMASILTGERKTQKEIAKIAHVTEITIRNRYKELTERLMFEISI